MSERIEKYPTRHIRLDDEVMDALKRGAAIHGSPNKALRAILLLIWGTKTPIAAEPDVTAFEEETPPTWDCPRCGTNNILAHCSKCAERSPASVAAHDPAPDTRPKNAHCKHCGNRFAGPKYATVCPQCQIDGHRTGDCAECRLNQGGA